MPHHTEDQRYRVSGVNRNLLQKGALIGGISFVVFLLIFLSLPVKYFFVFKGGTLELCVGRIGWLDGSRDKGFEPVYLGEEKDSELEALLSKKFQTKEEALEALKPYALHRIHKHIAAIADLEQKMFQHYHVLLGEFMAAKQAGIENLDQNIEALKAWLNMYGRRGQYHREEKIEKVAESKEQKVPKKETQESKSEHHERHVEQAKGH